jgi:alpha/beta superfamily hydrolase
VIVYTSVTFVVNHAQVDRQVGYGALKRGLGVFDLEARCTAFIEGGFAHGLGERLDVSEVLKLAGTLCEESGHDFLTAFLVGLVAHALSMAAQVR